MNHVLRTRYNYHKVVYVESDAVEIIILFYTKLEGLQEVSVMNSSHSRRGVKLLAPSAFVSM